MTKLKTHCNQCNVEILRFESQIKTRNFCSSKCKKIFFKGKNLKEIHGEQKANEILKKISINSTGENNSRYVDGRCSKKYFCPDCNIKIDGRSNHCSKCAKKYYDLSLPHTKESKIKIGIKSKAKFTPEYNQKIRSKREKGGNIKPLNQIDDYDFYYKLCNWQKSMLDLIEDENQIKLLKEKQVFNYKTNSKGVVRDHSFSRFSGFNQGVFPEILRHPCNCQLLTHGNNIAKHHSKNINSDSLTLNELFEKIIHYNKNWFEQKQILILINNYKNGQRYNKQKYINDWYK